MTQILADLARINDTSMFSMVGEIKGLETKVLARLRQLEKRVVELKLAMPPDDANMFDLESRVDALRELKGGDEGNGALNMSAQYCHVPSNWG